MAADFIRFSPVPHTGEQLRFGGELTHPITSGNLNQATKTSVHEDDSMNEKCFHVSLLGLGDAVAAPFSEVCCIRKVRLDLCDFPRCN